MINERRKIILEEENTFKAEDCVGKRFREREREREKSVWGGEGTKTVERDRRKMRERTC